MCVELRDNDKKESKRKPGLSGDLGEKKSLQLVTYGKVENELTGLASKLPDI